jgi:Ca2+-transporting ATPase
MVLVLVLILLGQVLIVQFGGRMFRTVPLSFTEWAVIVGITSLVLWVPESIRLLRLKVKAKIKGGFY